MCGVSQHPLNNSLAVFIHGIWGSRWVTWRSHVDFFQRLPTERPELRSYEFTCLPTGLLVWPRAAIARERRHELRMFLEGARPRYDTVVLVLPQPRRTAGEDVHSGRTPRRSRCHDEDRFCRHPQHSSSRRRLSKPLFLFGLALSELLNRTPVVRRFYILRQLRDLSPWGRNVRFLEENWDTHISTVPGTAEPDHRYIRSIAICGLKDWLVSSTSAEGFYVDEKDATFNGHSVDSEQLASYVGHLLSGYENPASLKT